MRAGPGRVPTPLMAEYYAQRAAAGLIVTEATAISQQGTGCPNTPGIYTDEQVAGWQRVTEAVHQAGGRIFLQLWHMGRISHPSFQPDGGLPVAPSAIAPRSGQVLTETGMQPYVTPRALEKEELPGIVVQYAVGGCNAPKPPASMAWKFTMPTAICSTSFSAMARTSAPMNMAARCGTAPG